MAERNIDTKLIAKLGDIMNDKGINELSIEIDGMALQMVKQSGQVVAMPTATPIPTPAPAIQAHPIATTENKEQAKSDVKNDADAITSPMVGTAYLSPKPEAEPFIKIGDSVKEGDTLLIIEAMKVMNPIVSTKSGKVTAIHVSDSQAVEFGHSLVTIH